MERTDVPLEESHPLTAAFLREYTVGIDSRMADPDNKNRPSLLVYVMKLAPTVEEMLESRRLMYLLYFATEADADMVLLNPHGHALDQRMEFYGPDGAVLFSINEKSEALHDSVVFPITNKAWGLEPDSPFMLRVNGLIAQATNMMMAAAARAAATHDDPQAMLEAMVRHASTGVTERLYPD